MLAAMARIARILSPVDFSGHSRHALDHAIAFARWYGARLTALHVPLAFVASLTPDQEVAYPTEPGPPQETHDLLDDLERFVAPARDAGVDVETRIEEGVVVDRILRLAEELPVELIVMGTHGRSGFERLVLGSVTEKVLRKARAPVLTIPPPAEEVIPSVPILFERILCATDFSEGSVHALAHAVSIAHEASASLTLLHAIEAGGIHEAGQSVAPDMQRDAEVAVRERLHGLVSEAARARCKVDEVVCVGRAWREILRVARDRDSSLIVLGTHGHHAIDRLLFGSVTNHIVRAASCPVLTLRGD